MKELEKIRYWLFDLDNTLYSGDTKVFDQVDKKMSKFISEKLKVSEEEAKKIQKNYFHEYNTTLNGMIKNHDIDANEFLEFVHDVDLNFLKKDVLLESHIFDFDHDIYEHLIKVEFVDFIRPEMKFDGLESLKAQIEKDCVTARELLALPQNQQSFISSPRLEEHL